jgi:hypothetical protein
VSVRGAVRNGETFLFTDMVGYAKGQALDEAAMITWAFRQLDAIIESPAERSGS